MQTPKIKNSDQKSILIPPDLVQTQTMQDQKPKCRWIKFLLGFFIFEHLIIFLLIFSFLFFYIRAHKYSDFAILRQKAIFFQAESTNTVISQIGKDLLEVLPKSQDERGWKRFDLKISETQINSLLQGTNFLYVDKIYVLLEGDNTFLLWFTLDKFPSPFMLRASYTFDPMSGVKINTTNFQIDILPIPISWISPLDYALSNMFSNLVLSIPSDYQFKIDNVVSRDGILEVSMLISKEQYTKLHGYLLSKYQTN